MFSPKISTVFLLVLITMSIHVTERRSLAQIVTKLEQNEAQEKNVSGDWIYRSFHSTPRLSDPTKPLSQILFGQGELRLNIDTSGKVTGTLGGPGWQLVLNGKYTPGSPSAIQFRGEGIINGEKWIYDYSGYVVPEWPNAVDQRPAIVGSIVRTTSHSGGASPAGYVAQWIAVKSEQSLKATSVLPVQSDDRPLDVVMKVSIDETYKTTCEFKLPKTRDQSFENTEYRYALLDKDGIQVKDVLAVRLILRTIDLPANEASVADDTDAVIDIQKLRKGETYFFVVSVRNVTALTRFEVK